MVTEDKGKVETTDESELMGVKPYASIGPGRTTDEAKVVEKLKQKKLAKGSTSQSGEEANVGKVSTAISSFVNR